MTRRMLLPLVVLVALAIPTAALANAVGNATLTVNAPKKHANKEWTGSATLKASKAEALQLEVCLQSNKKTVAASCTKVHGTVKALAATSKEAKGSSLRTWAWADVDGKTSTAVS
ncbi:MAG TPA: hypothetical protein VEF89_22440 [Solirubrobacteraceae bacterium]|nr:hypothetical protein [Solirubrobacteraceae bacterium]